MNLNIDWNMCLDVVSLEKVIYIDDIVKSSYFFIVICIYVFCWWMIKEYLMLICVLKGVFLFICYFIWISNEFLVY